MSKQHTSQEIAAGGGLGRVAVELRAHAPFSLLGALTGMVLMAIMVRANVSPGAVQPVFASLHALHILLSAVVTAGLYRRHGGGLIAALLIGMTGAIGIATLSDILFPHHGAALALLLTGGDPGDMHLHIAVFEIWYFIIPAGLLGTAIGILWPRTKVSHAGHVLLSVWASLFYIIAHSSPETVWLPRLPLVLIVLFIAVWLPCCVSDIVFPMLFVKDKRAGHEHRDE